MESRAFLNALKSLRYMCQGLGGYSWPTFWGSTKVGNNEQNLLLIGPISAWIYGEREETLRNKGAVLREFPAKFSGFVYLGSAMGGARDGRDWQGMGTAD
jgi:hypothetical protein